MKEGSRREKSAGFNSGDGNNEKIPGSGKPGVFPKKGTTRHPIAYREKRIKLRPGRVQKNSRAGRQMEESKADRDSQNNLK